MMAPSQPERIDLYDAGSNPLGRTVRRGEPLAPGEYHLVVQVWVRNSRGEFLIQKRRLGLDEAPGLWAATAGWVAAGEDSLEGAVRELEEELGIRASPNELSESGPEEGGRHHRRQCLAAGARCPSGGALSRSR